MRIYDRCVVEHVIVLVTKRIKNLWPVVHAHDKRPVYDQMSIESKSFFCSLAYSFSSPCSLSPVPVCIICGKLPVHGNTRQPGNDLGLPRTSAALSGVSTRESSREFAKGASV